MSSGDLRTIALSAHNKIQDVWGTNKIKAKSVISKLEPDEVEAFALDYAIHCIWDLHNNGCETGDCYLSKKNTILIRKNILEVLEEFVEGLTFEESFEILDPVAVEQRNKEKQEKAIADMIERNKKKESIDKEKKERALRIEAKKKKDEEECEEEIIIKSDVNESEKKNENKEEVKTKEKKKRRKKEESRFRCNYRRKINYKKKKKKKRRKNKKK